MYAAIIDPTNSVYTSGSETYAQIPSINNAPVTMAANNIYPSTSQNNGNEKTLTHSRKGK